MLRYALRRVLLVVPVLVGVSVASFLLLHLIPGDPAVILAGVEARPEELDAIRREFGLTDPLAVQYLRYVARAVRGDLGISIRTREPVSATLAGRLAFTVQLTVASLLLAVGIGVAAGVLAATHQNSWVDSGVMVLALVGVSMPSFWLGLLLLLVFSGMLQWLPSGGGGSLRHLILPAIVLGTSGAPVIARLTRASMLEVIRQDYIRTLRAYGLPDLLVVYKHGLRNAINPVITLVGLQFGFLLAGAVIVETVFALPGVGRLMVTAIFSRDYPVIQGGLLVIAVAFVLVNLLTDLTYGWVNPRVRYERG
jgi:ABC-type dipeptide/oligopeptide/nickel transport system permease component